MEEARQNNDDVSMATVAAKEAPGKGSVDAGSFRQRQGFKEKPKLEPVVIEVNLDSSTDGYLASKQAAEIAGVVSVELGGPDRNQLQVIGDGVDAVHLVNLLRKKFGNAKLISPGPVKEPMKDVMEEKPMNKEELQDLQTPVSPSIPHLLLPIIESTKSGAKEMGNGIKTRSNPSLGNTESSCKTSTKSGAKEMGNGIKTRSNPSLGNTESSCKSKTAEWALLVTSVVLEATSASCDQLGYALPSMVMAFLALFLSILDLILKARGREITCDGRGLPCFNRHSSHDSQNRKPFASLVQYFGLAGAVWQCSFTTVGYHYTHQKLVNPIKLCLLPFILAFCLLISKVVKSSQHER